MKAVDRIIATRRAQEPLDVAVPGGTITMRPFSSREYLAMRKGDYNDVQMMEMTVEAIVTYLPGEDPWDLPPEGLLAITKAWLDARRDVAVPPQTA